MLKKVIIGLFLLVGSIGIVGAQTYEVDPPRWIWGTWVPVAKYENDVWVPVDIDCVGRVCTTSYEFGRRKIVINGSFAGTSYSSRVTNNGNNFRQSEGIEDVYSFGFDVDGGGTVVYLFTKISKNNINVVVIGSSSRLVAFIRD